MLRNRKRLRTAIAAVAASLCIPAVAMSASYLVRQPEPAPVVSLESASPVERAAIRFIRAMVANDASTVWLFATEEEHDAFQTEDEMLRAYSEDFPVFALAKGVEAEREWQEGNATFVEVTLADGDRNQYIATMGFWLSDAGDWQLISCGVKPVSERVAGL